MPTVNNINDLAGLARLKIDAIAEPDAAVKEVAKQFESLFIQMMVKAMRDAVPEGGFLNSDQMETYTQMHDQQLSMDIANNGGIGLAKIIERQLSGPGAAKITDTGALDKTARDIAAPPLMVADMARLKLSL